MPEFPPLTQRTPDISESFDRIVRKDIRSANWNGGGDLSSGKDASASSGYLLDYATGSAQYQQIYAEGGSLGDLTVTDTITLGSGGEVLVGTGSNITISGTGVIRSATAGLRYELGATGTYAKLDFYSGHASETQQGMVRQIGGVAPIMAIFTPVITGVNSALTIQSDQLTITTRTGYAASIDGASGATLQSTAGHLNLYALAAGKQIRIVVDSSASATDGTAALPALSFANDPDTGIYRAASNILSISTGGNQQIRISADRTDISSTLLGLPVKATTGDPGSPANGDMYVNTFDNKVRVYADSAWRDLVTW